MTIFRGLYKLIFKVSAILILLSTPLVAQAQSQCSNVFINLPRPSIANPNTSPAPVAQALPSNPYADLSPLKNFKYTLQKYEIDRFYPNVGGSFRSLVHRLIIGTHHMEIIIPKGSGHEGAADGIIRTILELPLKRIEAFNTVRLNTRANKDDHYWRQAYAGRFTHSVASTTGGAMDIYSASLSNFHRGDSEALRITRHEFGHMISEQVFGSATPAIYYTYNASRDRYVPSEYSKSSWTEDFAEGIEAYLRTHSGILKPALRSQLVQRFSFFDQIFNYTLRVPQSEQEKALKAGRTEIFVKLINETEILALAPEIGLGILLKID